MAIPVEELADEVRLVWRRLVEVQEALHRRESVTLGMRAVLEILLHHGPATVPALARRQQVTRQHVQALVNGLYDHHLVALAPNPAHRRSPLVALTPEGERTARRMKGREDQFLEALPLSVSPGELRRAAAVLRAVRAALDKPRS